MFIDFIKHTFLALKTRKNIENNSAYSYKRTILPKPGFSAMLRVKNEEKNIYKVLGTIYEFFDEIVLIDNESTDKTLDEVNKFIEKIDTKNKVKIYHYPFNVARCGDEHFNTDEFSLHNLAYYYNWCLSKCKHIYVFKWDADMFLIKDQVDDLKAYFKKHGFFEYSRKKFIAESNYLQKINNVVITRAQVLFLSLDNKLYLSDHILKEVRVMTNICDNKYIKKELFEAPSYADKVNTHHYKEIISYEFKNTSENEFDHWSKNMDQENLSARKKIEYSNYMKVKNNKIDDSFVEIFDYY